MYCVHLARGANMLNHAAEVDAEEDQFVLLAVSDTHEFHANL